MYCHDFHQFEIRNIFSDWKETIKPLWLADFQKAAEGLRVPLIYILVRPVVKVIWEFLHTVITVRWQKNKFIIVNNMAKQGS